MELQDYLNVVRKRWRIIALVALAVTALAALYTILSPKVYSSTTEFFVSTTGSDASQLQQGNSFTQQRVKTYSQLLTTPRALDPVIEKLSLNVSADDLSGNITATVPLDTVLIDVEVTGHSPGYATEVARALGDTFPSVVEQIEQVKPGQAAPVKVTVVKDAATETTPVSPKPVRNIGLGVVLGLLAGFGLALLRDVLDISIKSAQDVQAITDSTVLGGITYDPDASEHPLIVQVDPRSPRAEAFRSLRTNLQFVDVADPPRSIVVTSSIPGEGKSTTTANLAISVAQTGSTVCVVEGDLRRPKLLEYLGYEGAVGLTDVLVGRAEVTDVIQPFSTKGMWLLGAGAIPPNPSELLGTSTMSDLLERLTGHFDYVIIDAPPLLPVTDAAVLSRSVDGAVVVVGAGIVSRDELRHALDSLHTVGGRVLGLILNRVSAKEARGGYGTYTYDYLPASERERAKTRQDRLSNRLRVAR